MDASQLNWITNFIWSIADDELRDLYVRGKYRDVILPVTVIRRLDAVLEPTKQAVLDLKAALDKEGIVTQRDALRTAAGQAFYNTSKFTLRDLRARSSRQQLEADFRDYLDGFSPNVQDILDNFEFRNQIPRLSKADRIGSLIEKLLDPATNLSPGPALNADGSVRLPGLDNHGMGTIFEELLRERMGGKSGVKDPRFIVEHQGEELPLLTRSSDGQMLFLANMLSKMKHGMPLGSRVAEVHNGSSLFTGDAGQGESNGAKTEADPLHGLFEATIGGKRCVVEYEPDTDLRDTEQVPLLEEGGIDAFLEREVLPYAPDAWYDAAGVKIGYEISFNRYFYKPKPMRTLEEIRADLLAAEEEGEGSLSEILGANA